MFTQLPYAPVFPACALFVYSDDRGSGSSKPSLHSYQTTWCRTTDSNLEHQCRVTTKSNWQVMVLVTFRYERYSWSCSKIFCWTVYKISTIYLAYTENRTRSTVQQHDQSLRQVTLASFVVLKKAADNFCGCNWESTFKVCKSVHHHIFK